MQHTELQANFSVHCLVAFPHPTTCHDFARVACLRYIGELRAFSTVGWLTQSSAKSTVDPAVEPVLSLHVDRLSTV